MRRAALALIASLIAAGAAAEPSAWPAVGRVDVGGRAFCTGALIREDVVLTAAHCLFTPEGHAVPTSGLRFLAGLRGGDVAASRGVAEALTSERYAPTLGAVPGNVSGDVAVLRLDAPIGAEIRPLVVGRAPGAGDAVSVISYAVTGPDDAAREGCAVLSREAGAVVTSCGAERGASGSPILAAGGEPRIVSVVSARSTEVGGPVSYGADLDRTLAPLMARLRGVPAPGSARRIAGAKFVRP